ncbi:MAG TPA: molybdopterin cofactor-binding domain-containing protein, partial [Streptosporangiaceae bacterium]
MSTPPPAPPPLPATLAANPLLSAWLDFTRPGVVTIFTGKVEYGQGVWTALAQVAAEELDVDLRRVRVAPVSTATSPDEGVTSGSRSIEESGSALRQACAQARHLFLAAAAGRLGTGAGALAVTDGEITTEAGGTGLTYWSLPGLLDRAAGDPQPAKAPARWSVAGRSAARQDIPDKVTGHPRFLHDVVLPGMRYGRVIRPPAPAASLAALGDAPLPGGVVTVRDGSFLGVVAPSDRAAAAAARAVAGAARWEVTPSLPDERDVKGFLLSAPAQVVTVDERHDEEAAAAVARTLEAEFTRPYLAHASMAPSCAVARWDGQRVTVWSHSQGVFALRGAIAAGLG